MQWISNFNTNEITSGYLNFNDCGTFHCDKVNCNF